MLSLVTKAMLSGQRKEGGMCPFVKTVDPTVLDPGLNSKPYNLVYALLGRFFQYMAKKTVSKVASLGVSRSTADNHVQLNL